MMQHRIYKNKWNGFERLHSFFILFLVKLIPKRTLQNLTMLIVGIVVALLVVAVNGQPMLKAEPSETILPWSQNPQFLLSRNLIIEKVCSGKATQAQLNDYNNCYVDFKNNYAFQNSQVHNFIIKSKFN